MSAKKINIGDYVRTDTGVIEKLEGIHQQNETNDTIIKLNKMGGGRYAHILDINSEFAKEFDKNFSRGNIIKSSPNIIDLVEENDIVNHSRVVCIGVSTDLSGTHKYLVLENRSNCANGNIKSIVTKEQLENMEYKIGEQYVKNKR